MNKISFKFQLVQNGIVYEELKTLPDGEITHDAQAEIKRSMSCSVVGGYGLLNSQIKVSMNINGTVKSLGTFIVTTAPKKVEKDGLSTYNIEAYDKSYLLYKKRMESRSEGYFAEGTRYIDVIRTLLIRCGITEIAITESDLTLKTSREDWDVGTTYLSMINTLLDEINYTSLYFDSEGIARSVPYESPVTRPVNHIYSAGQKSTILREHTLDTEIFDSCNIFTVATSSHDSPLFAKAVNDDPYSRLSTINRGRIQAPLVTLRDVADQATAQAYANKLRLKSMLSTETASIQTLPEHGHGNLDIVEINIHELKGKFEEVKWSIPFEPGRLMSHTIRRAVYV